MHADTDLSDGSDRKIQEFGVTRAVGTRNSTSEGFSEECADCGYDSWIRWRIESPPTRVQWKEAYHYCNKGTTKDTVKYRVKSSITTSTSTTNAVSMDAKISAGLGAGELLQSAGVQLGFSWSWSRTYMEQLAQEEGHEVIAIVEPGMMLVVTHLDDVIHLY